MESTKRSTIRWTPGSGRDRRAAAIIDTVVRGRRYDCAARSSKRSDRAHATRPKQPHIACFLEIVRQGSIAGAAESLSVTQPTVSRTLADLEGILNARLLERSWAGVSLTTAGETFQRYASASASALDQGVEQVANQARCAQRSACGRSSQCCRTCSAGSDHSFQAIAARRARAHRHRHQSRADTGTEAGRSRLRGRTVGGARRHVGAPFRSAFPGRSRRRRSPRGIRFSRSTLRARSPPQLLLTASSCLCPARSSGRMPSSSFCPSGQVSSRTSSRRSVEFCRAYVESTSAIWITPGGTVQESLDRGTVCLLPLDFAATRGTVGISVRNGPGSSQVYGAAGRRMATVANGPVLLPGCSLNWAFGASGGRRMAECRLCQDPTVLLLVGAISDFAGNHRSGPVRNRGLRSKGDSASDAPSGHCCRIGRERRDHPAVTRIRSRRHSPNREGV